MDLTRREFTVAALGAALAPALAKTAEPQAAPVADLDKMIEEAKARTRQASQVRLGIKLKEGSEPCFIYRPESPR